MKKDNLVFCPVCHLSFDKKTGKYTVDSVKSDSTTNTEVCSTCKEFDEKEAWL